MIPATALNLASRIPGISSFESVKKFTAESEDAIIRALRLNFIMFPVILLFLSGAAINVVPGVLGEENMFFSLVDWFVESLGALKTICAVVGKNSFQGTTERVSALTSAEDFLRALSTKNYMKEISCDHALVMSA